MSDVESFLTEITAKDPTWQRAYDIVQSELHSSSIVWPLIRTAWNGSTDQRSFLKMLCFSRLNLTCLIDAAGLLKESNTPNVEVFSRSLDTLGIRLCAVVLGVNYVCQTVLNRKPPPIWRRLFQELMNDVEIGYRIGAKASLLGVEGGALIGFSRFAGQLVLLSADSAAFKKWYSSKTADSSAIEFFGCEVYQVSAFVLQQLGYGHEVAIGSIVGNKKVDQRFLQVDDRTLMWKAALLWIEALREARNYPASPEMRQMFAEIAPPRESSLKNPALEVLWTEVARVRSEGSNWTWHLPRPGYDETAELIKG